MFKVCYSYENSNSFQWFFVRKAIPSRTFNIDIGMLDLKQLTADVCRIATEAGHFLKEDVRISVVNVLKRNMRMIMSLM